MSTRHLPLATLLLATLASPGAGAQPVCSRADIDHYLARGFTPEQVVRLCGSAEKSVVPPPAAPPAAAPAAAAPAAPAEDVAVLRTALDAEDVQVDDKEIRYTWERCLPFGEEGYGGLRERACVTLVTHIDRHGLRVLKAAKGIPLLRDPVLRVAGHIRREAQGLERLNKRQRADFLRDYPPQTDRLDIPLKRSMDPRQIAAVLKRLALP